METLQKQEVLGGVCASAVLCDLSISVWVGRKIDHNSTRKVVADNNATTADAALVTKRLFTGNKNLDAISSLAGRIRAYVDDKTLPWMGNLKLLPMDMFLTFQSEMRGAETEFKELVEAFLDDYDVQVSAMAFKLGGLFNRADYPTVPQLRDKFRLSWVISPVPTSGDFRVEAEQSLRDELQAAYSKAAAVQLDNAMRQVWDRMRDCLTHIKDRLSDDGDKPKVFRNSMLDNAGEMVTLMKSLNITGDPKLEQARRDLAQLLSGIDSKELRTSESVRADTKAGVDALLGKLAF